MNDILKQMNKMNDKQQLHFLLSNANVFVDDPLLYILAVSDTLKERLSYLKYLQLLNNISIQKRNTALLKATSDAFDAAEALNI